MPRVQAVTDGTPESVERDLAAMPRRVQNSLLRQLAEGERIVIRTRQHPAVLVRPAVWPTLALVAYVWFDVGLHVAPPLLRLVGIALLVGLARLAWAEADRRFRWIVVTNKRILKHEGVLDTSVPMMRLTKVTDMTFRRSLLGELAGFGTIIIESAGQQQAIRELTFLPEPEAVNAALNSEIFGEKPREKRRARGRSWPKLPRRGRRRDDGPDEDPGGGPPRGRGPGPSDNDPTVPGGGVDVSPAGHPTMQRTAQETWYRSSNLPRPSRLGDTGEIPVVRAAEPTPRAHRDVPFDQEAAGSRPWHDDPSTDGHVREIPLYPPREWVRERP